jgi:thioester reductase-like protein
MMATQLEEAATDAGLEHLIVSITARCLNRAPQTIDPDTPLALLGLDSLGAIEVGAALEDALDVEIPSEVMTECLDVRSLAAAIQQRRGATGNRDERARAIERMRMDAVLPDDVQPVARARGTGNARGLLDARRILLTGSTGFLGSRLAADLLTSSSAELVCLVRPGSASANERVRAALNQWSVDLDGFAARVHIIGGDLSQPQLGLDRVTFAGIGQGLDGILHAGASVNWVGSYAALRDANVAGTRELLRLACLGGTPFHFVSSISTCYSTSAPRTVDETFDGLEHLEGVYLGYAQTKIVSEALVREAARRGLLATIYRPSLISGDSRTGSFNRDDLLSLMIKGVVEMGVAPDLDWTLDCQPVDVVSRQILQLSAQPGRLFHLVHDRPRHWRECLLWMRLAGYQVRLLAYPEWLRVLDEHTRPGAPGSPTLRPLRAFFLERLTSAEGLTRPELYEESRRTTAVAQRTTALLHSRSTETPPLDAALLDRYFDAFANSGHLSAPARPRRQCAARVFDESFFSSVLHARELNGEITRAELLGSGSEHSIISELTAWRTGCAAGLLRYRLHFAAGTVRDVVVKVKASDKEAIAVGAALASLCGERIGAAYERWQDRVGLAASHVREPAIYAMQDARFVRHLPAMLGCSIDPDSDARTLVLEQIDRPILMNSVMRPWMWTPRHLNLAIDGLAALQSAWYGHTETLLEQPWIGWVASSSAMAEMTDLWEALAEQAGPLLERWAGADAVGRHRHAIDSIEQWWPLLERTPRSLIHHDFNPRNLCFRRHDGELQLCAYDWELATVGAPQRDLAELICFVLTRRATDAEIDGAIERHRAALEREAGVSIGAAGWRRGFHAALRDLLVNRLAMYALINRVKRQDYLPRVLSTWRRLDDHLSAHGGLA